MSKIEEQVISKIKERAIVGGKKYNTTMERNDLTTEKWLRYLQEELLDAAIYTEKLLMCISNNEINNFNCKTCMKYEPPRMYVLNKD